MFYFIEEADLQINEEMFFSENSPCPGRNKSGNIFYSNFFSSGPEQGIISEVSVLVICSALVLIGVFICFVRSLHANKYLVLSPQFVQKDEEFQ